MENQTLGKQANNESSPLGWIDCILGSPLLNGLPNLQNEELKLKGHRVTSAPSLILVIASALALAFCTQAAALLFISCTTAVRKNWRLLVHGHEIMVRRHDLKACVW